MEKKFLKIAIVMVLLVFVYSSVVNALSFTATMTPSKTTVPESTEFTVSVKVSNLDVGANGINSLSGYLKYDEGVFEKIGDTSIEALSGWTVSYNAENRKVALTKTSFVKTEESVFQVTFKTKNEIGAESGKIEFTNIVASNSASDINASDISITINIGEESTEEGGASGANVTGTNTSQEQGQGPSQGQATPSANKTTNTSISVSTDKKNTNTNTNTNKTTNTSTNASTNTNKNNVGGAYNSSTNTSEENIPYTGVEDTLMILIGAILMVAFVSYIKFERINKEMK